MAPYLTVSTVTAPSLRELGQLGLTKERLHGMLRKMVEIRRFEEKVEELFLVHGQLIGPSHLYLGQEAVATGICTAAAVTDVLVTTYRCHGHALAKGVPAKLVMAELFGKATGTCRGLGGSMHASIYPEVNSLYATAIVGSGVPIAAGMGWAIQRKSSRQAVLVFFGDGAVNTGAFHEGANIAALWGLPVLLICENNQYAMSTRVDRAVAGRSIAERGSSYGMHSLVVDGNDVLAVFRAASEAVQRIRDGHGPVFLESRTYKQKGHGVYDKGEYRPREEVERWLKLDPITRFAHVLEEQGLLTERELQAIRDETEHTLADAVRFAQESPVLPFDELAKYVYVAP